MAEVIAIVGPSGSGKSTSTRNLDPSETFYIAVDSKGLPFQGWKKKYQKTSPKEFDKGNYLHIEDPEKMEKVFVRINDERPDIKTVIVDDYQFIMGNEFMYKWNEKG